MKTSSYDFAIVGAGPIGAATAFFLSQKTKKKIALFTAEPVDDHSDTYRYAGGSVRRYWKDPQKHAMTTATADFVLALAKKRIDLSLIEDRYVFLGTGATAPSLNISGAKLVSYFIQEARKRGVVYQDRTALHAITSDAEGCALSTYRGTYHARKVLLALGAKTADFMPVMRAESEKRVLLILDLPVTKEQEAFPHVVVPFKNGVVYVFVKKMDGRYRFVLGEEDVIDHEGRHAPKDFLPLLKKEGILEMFPFLMKAKTEKISWGFDVAHKMPLIATEDGRLFGATCGSAVRSCVAIGKEVAKKLLE